MPLLLGKDSLREWVRPDGDPGRIAKKALTNIVMEKATDILSRSRSLCRYEYLIAFCLIQKQLVILW